MQYNDSLSSTFKVGDIVVESQLGFLVVNGQQVKIEPRAMELLQFLVDNHGRVCSKADISAELWPRQHISDEVITRLIFVLRSSLGDNAKEPKFISTVSKKGYIFLQQPRAIQQKSSQYVRLLAVVAFTFVLLAYLYYSSSSKSFTVVNNLPVTHTDGKEYGYVKSDNLAAWLYQTDNQTQVVVERAGEKQELTTDNWQKRSLVIVGEFLHYIRFNSFEYQIVRQSLTGDTKVLVTSNKPIFSLLYNPYNQLFIYNQYKNNDRVYLRQFSLVSNEVADYLPNKGDWPDNLYSPEFSEDGSTLYYVGIESKKPMVYMFEQGEGTKQILHGFTEISDLEAGDKPYELFVSGKRNFRNGIWLLNANTGEFKLLYSYSEGKISDLYYQDSTKTLYYSSWQTRVDIKHIDFNNKLDELANINSTKQDSSARFLSSDNTLYFASNRTGYVELYQYNLDVKQLKKITSLNASNIWYYSLSNDGEKLAVVYSTDKIYLATIDTNSMTTLAAKELEEIKYPLSWSHDNDYIYVSEHLENIAMYRYKADDLSIVNKKLHMGMSAYQLGEGEIISFDYVTKRFVSYNFERDSLVSLSGEVDEHMTLSPNKAMVTKDGALLLFEDGRHKKVFKFDFSQSTKYEEPSLVAELLFAGDINTFNNTSDGLVFSSIKNLQGDVHKLELTRE